MTTTNINVCVNKVLKQYAEELFRDMGLNISTAIIMFLKNALEYDGIPFEVHRHSFNPETRDVLDEYNEMKTASGSYKRYDSFDVYDCRGD